MSTTSKKIPIDPKSKALVESQLTTDQEYRELDAYLRMIKEEDSIKKRRLSRDIEDVGEEMVAEIETKALEKEEKRIQMIEYIYDHSQEKFITLKEANKLAFEDITPIYENVVEWEKPWWRKLVNVFR